MAEYRSRRRPRRFILRENGGSLYDVTAGRQISRSELGGYLARGGFFQARRPDGAECTAQVLAEVLAEALDEDLLSNLPAVSLAGHAIETLFSPRGRTGRSEVILRRRSSPDPGDAPADGQAGERRRREGSSQGT